MQKAEELEFVIKIIFGKALVEPHYCHSDLPAGFRVKSRSAKTS